LPAIDALDIQWHGEIRASGEYKYTVNEESRKAGKGDE
jgi:hypothetical protein